MSLQANLKAESSTKTLLQRCQDLVKIIDEYPAKVAAAAARSTAAKCHVGRLCREDWEGMEWIVVKGFLVAGSSYSETPVRYRERAHSTG